MNNSLPTSDFEIGDFVQAKDKSIRYGIVSDIYWHTKDNQHKYHLTINGKQYKKRYSSDQLRLISKTVESSIMSDMLKQLELIIADRKENPQEGSYTNFLFEKGRNKIAQKVGEEAVEVIVAALGQQEDDQIAELADLFYHTLVLMSELGLTLDDIEKELEKRHNPKVRS